MARFKVPRLPGLPRFCGGLVGYFGYDTVRYIEPQARRDASKPDPLGTPDILLMLSEELAVVDNLSGKLTLVVYAEPGVPGAWQQAQARLKELLAQAARSRCTIPPDDAGRRREPAASEFGEEAFKAAVERAKQYILDGDIMQVVLSQRMSKPFARQPLALYRALRTLNPSPYMFYFDFERLPRRRRLAGDPGAAGRTATRHRCARSPARARAAPRRRRTRRWPPNCWPTRRSAPST